MEYIYWLSCVSLCSISITDTKGILKGVLDKINVVDNEGLEALDWSPWLNFDRDTIANIVASEGVYKLHASMKMLFIGSSHNVKESILGCLSDHCISKAQRFSYAIIEDADKVKEQLLKEYRNKHNGKMPSCME